MNSGVPNSAARSRTSSPPMVSTPPPGGRFAARWPGAARSGHAAARAGARRAARRRGAVRRGGRHGSWHGPCWSGLVSLADVARYGHAGRPRPVPSGLRPRRARRCQQPQAGPEGRPRGAGQLQPGLDELPARRQPAGGGPGGTAPGRISGQPSCQSKYLPASSSRYAASTCGCRRRAAPATRSGSQDIASSSACSLGWASRRGWNRSASGPGRPRSAACRRADAACACAYRTA